MNQSFVITPGLDRDSAGLITWWELTGLVDLEDLRDTWVAEGLPEALLPKPPSLTLALIRAAQDACETKRHLVRPLKSRGHWELTMETVVGDASGERLEHRALVQGFARKDGDVETPVVRVMDPDAGPRYRDRILGRTEFYRHALTPTDVSTWLLEVLATPMFHAIGLRARGGFYFIPRGDAVRNWETVGRVLHAVSAHRVSQIPALQTSEAVEAILTAVRREAEGEMRDLETYLAGETSTRGLNAAARRATAVQEKLGRYVTLLGAELPDLDQRGQALIGAVTAAKLMAADGGN